MPSDSAQGLNPDLKELIAEILDVDPKQVTPEAFFGEDLDADSIDLIELVAAIEKRFDVVIEEEEVYEIETVAQLASVVSSKLA